MKQTKTKRRARSRLVDGKRGVKYLSHGRRAFKIALLSVGCVIALEIDSEGESGNVRGKTTTSTTQHAAFLAQSLFNIKRDTSEKCGERISPRQVVRQRCGKSTFCANRNALDTFVGKWMWMIHGRS